MTDFESSSMRVSDADRESAMTALGEHMSTGRLTVDEYGDRAAQVAAAKTRRDLLVLFDDLPQPRPTLSGVDQPVAAPPPAAPAPVVRSRAGTALAMAALVPVSWVAAVPVTMITGYWAVFLIPILLTVIGAVLLGRGVHRLGRRVAGNFTQATGFNGFGGDWAGREYRDERQEERYHRDAARWERHAARFAQRNWQGEMFGQIGAEIQRGMRGASGRGGSYRRHHHGRRRGRW